MTTTIKKLHPTLKKCACSFIGNRAQLYAHLDKASEGIHSHVKLATEFYHTHGEVPLNEEEGDAWLNARYQKELSKGYDD